MTRKLFWEDPYLSKIETTIKTIDGHRVTVDRTILYPFSGGQERDHGTIGNREVTDVFQQGRELMYVLQNTTGLRVGDILPMHIDWERRYALMRLHFAAELVLEVTLRSCPAIEKIGAHISPDKARIDFLWKENLNARLPGIQTEVNRLIEEDHTILSEYSNVENEQRVWEVPGFARVACGGTHLKRTGEIGRIRLRRDNIGRGKERIEILLDEAFSPRNR
ncbi:MAG: alanyl-tRNA editing protein [Chloroflexi bacterium]|nr:alanyl-tRNA editing protein [Chloroflexota bacterium]